MSPPAPASSDDAPVERAPSSGRIASLDALRGLIMVLMLLDHARGFFLHADLGDPIALDRVSRALFFQRLVTHLCAPTFIVLAGLSAYLYGRKHGGVGAASAFLAKRGVFLVVLEATVITYAWTFGTHSFIFQVIWAIGASMIGLAALIHLPRPVLLAVGLALVLGHNLTDPLDAIWSDQPAWILLHAGGRIPLPFDWSIRLAYPALPWLGIMTLGYFVGPWFTPEIPVNTRRRRLLFVASGALGLFAVLRLVNGYGDPEPWAPGSSGLEAMMSFVNVSKYPPSADYALLTLGVATLLFLGLDRVNPHHLSGLVVFGAVPLFFYVAHLYLLHAASVLAGRALGLPGDFAVESAPALWPIAIAAGVPLWLLCRWVAKKKRASRAAWTSYL